jgi:F420H(2)-dependent quinone reductase
MSGSDELKRAFVRLHLRLYERTDGRLGHRLLGVPSLLLFTTGARSGLRRTAVLAYARDASRFVVVASNDGLDRPPAWLLNVAADERAGLQVGRRRYDGRACVIEPGDDDYPRLWRLVNGVNHGRYDAYQRRTARPIALVVIELASTPA